MSEKPRHHQDCPWRPPHQQQTGSGPLVLGPACQCDDLWTRDLGYERGKAPAFRDAAQPSEEELRQELVATRNARDLAVEAFEGVSVKLAEARKDAKYWAALAEIADREWDEARTQLDRAPRITDNGRGVPTYYLWEPDGTRVELVTLGRVETLVKLSQGITGMPVEQEPPTGTVVVDAAHIAWQRRDADRDPSDATRCWFEVGSEESCDWSAVLAAGSAVVVWRPRPIAYDHAHVTISPSTGRALCTACGTTADTAEELATVPCEMGQARADRIAGILDETQASHAEALERLRTEGDGDQ